MQHLLDLLQATCIPVDNIISKVSLLGRARATSLRYATIACNAAGVRTQLKSTVQSVLMRCGRYWSSESVNVADWKAVN